MTPVATPELDARSAASAKLDARVTRHPLIAGLTSGVLLWMAFPPVGWSGMAWIALVPLFWLATVNESSLKCYFAAWIGGLTFWLLALEWVRLCDPSAVFGWVLMAFVLSLWWPAFLAFTRLAMVRLRLPLIIAAPITWVAVEYLREYFLSGFPWYYLAHSQYKQVYLIQIADITGALGVSMLIAVFNALMVDLLSRPLLHVSTSGVRLRRSQNVRLCCVTILLGTALCYGSFRLAHATFRDGPKLALLQSNIPRRQKAKSNPEERIAGFSKLIDQALAAQERPDLIVWPETAYPFGYITIEPAIDPLVFERQVRSLSGKITVDDWLETARYVPGHLHDLADKAGVPMLVGVTLYAHQREIVEKFNAAILFRPNVATGGIRNVATNDIYRKMHLVPFGEYVPFIDRIPWMAALTPYPKDHIPRLNFGQRPAIMPLGDYRMAVSICFEDTIPHVIARSFSASAASDQPDLLINLTNDGWFHGSAELDMHLAIGVFRAVEHRVALARAVNTGLTALVDGNGEVQAFLPKESSGVLSVTVPIDDRTSVYSRAGDWLGLSCLAVTIGFVPLQFLRRERQSRRGLI